MPATTAKLPIIKNIGTTATWEFVRNCDDSLPNTFKPGSMPIISMLVVTPNSPNAAASGTYNTKNTQTSNTLNWSFNSGAEAFNNLAVGQSLTLTYTVRVTDGTGAKLVAPDRIADLRRSLERVASPIERPV